MGTRIGIDLDNTILEYRAVFQALALDRAWVAPDCPAEKGAIKSQLAAQAGDADEAENRWQQLQAIVYGEQIHKAILLEGFTDFVLSMRQRGCALFIVSHKSETSHIKPEVRLRDHALATLEQRGFFLTPDQNGLGFTRQDIFFESTRQEKIQRIRDLELTHFIDDMSLVLKDQAFPPATQPILIGDERSDDLPSFDSWSDIQQYLELEVLLPKPGNSRLISCSLVRQGGNNRLVHWVYQDGTQWAVKFFLVDPEDTRPRREQEWQFARFLWDQGIQRIPRPLASLGNANVMAWVNGRVMAAGDEGRADQMSDFLVNLDRAGVNMARPKAIGKAADARFSISDHLWAVERRWESIREACIADERTQILNFLEKDLSPLRDQVTQHCLSRCEEYGLDPEESLKKDLWFPSPSDFGAHNCLIDQNNRLIFMDFEYAGWDDPAKILCDFLRHVGNNLAVAARMNVIRSFIGVRQRDPDLMHRFRALADLNGLEWILIVLNVVTNQESRRKQFAGLEGEPLVQQRFERAQNLYRQFQSIEQIFEDGP